MGVSTLKQQCRPYTTSMSCTNPHHLMLGKYACWLKTSYRPTLIWLNGQMVFDWIAKVSQILVLPGRIFFWFWKPSFFLIPVLSLLQISCKGTHITRRFSKGAESNFSMEWGKPGRHQTCLGRTSKLFNDDEGRLSTTSFSYKIG